jgi:hypothetical protein
MIGESGKAGRLHGPRTHDIGAGGVVSVSVEADDVRIRGVDGTEVRVVAPADGAGIETNAEPGRFAIRTAGGARGVILGIRIGGRGFGVHVAGTIELEVPRDARVEIVSAAGDVTLRDMLGGASVRTLSGDVSVKGAAGRIAVNVASGDVTVLGAAPVSLDLHSVSGDIRARAPRFDRVAIETISGDAELGGVFGAESAHLITTVSGDVELSVSGGLSLEVKTVSGDVECSHPDRREGDGRKRPLVIGDGAARLAIRSMSGDVEVRAGRAEPAAAPAASDPAEAFGFHDIPQPPAPPLAPPPPPPGPPAARATPPAPLATGDPDETLAVLEALARGEIDVAEAERRLAGVPAGPNALAARRAAAAAPEAMPDA